MIPPDQSTVDELRTILANPAISPPYRQVIEKRLQELSRSSGEPTAPDAPKAAPQKAKPYPGVAHMTLAEIIEFYGSGHFYRGDQPISGLQALQSLYSKFGALGQDHEVVARVAEAIKRMGGEVPEMERVRIDDLLGKR